jgi:hypothetical protein
MHIGFFGLLTLLFIGLKLAHFIDWSWWLVTLPAWGGAAFALVMMFLGLGFAVLGSATVKTARR